MAGMGGMGGGMQSELMNLGINGIQNTNKQEYNQRQALFQNIMSAMSDDEWLRQHYPNFYGWNTQGGGSQYNAASNAPQAYVGQHYNPDVAGSQQKLSSAKNQQAQADYYGQLSGQSAGTSGGYSSLWS